METTRISPETSNITTGPVSRSKYDVPRWTEMLWEMSNDLEDDILEDVLRRYNAVTSSGDDVMDDDGDKDVSGVQASQTTDEKWKHKFRETMTESEDELKIARRLRDVYAEMNLHSGKFEPLAEVVDNYIRSEVEFRNNFVNEVFVGREEALGLLYEKFNSPNVTCGINIWGLGGQGKSALAKKVCFKMMEEGWTVIKVDLRDVSRVVDLAKHVLVGSRKLCPQHDDRRELMELTRQLLSENDTRTLYFLDNCDKLIDSDKSGMTRFLEMCFVSAKPLNKVRILLTTRQKLTVNKEEFSQKRTCKFTHGPSTKLPELAEFQLHALPEPEAVQLFKTVAEKDDVDDRLALEIVSACGCSPHAINIVASLVKDGRFSTERLCAHLKLDDKNITKALHMSDLIKDAIGSLEPELQKALVKLSVFPNTQFNLQAACEVLAIPTSEKKEAKDVLHELHQKHLVECENKLGSMTKHTSDKKLFFSLHPLVHRYLCEWRKPKELEHAYNDGVRSFMELYEKRIGQVVNKMNTKGLKGAEMLQEHKSHIVQYYDILHDKHELLKPYPRKIESKEVLSMKRVSDLTDLLLSDVKKRRLFQSESERARRDGCDDMYVFWMVEKADVLLMLHDKPGLAKEILDDITNGKFAALRGLHADTFYRPIVHALFHKVKGLVLWKLVSHDLAVKHLSLALHFYKKRDHRVYWPLMARVYCFMGQVYLDKDDLDNAERSFTEGFRMLTGRDPVVDVDDTNSGPGPGGLGDKNQRAGVQVDTPVYYAHFAKIELKRAFIDPDNKEKHLDKAQELLREGMELDEQLKLERLDNYCLKQKLLADVFTEKEQFDEALKLAEGALDHRREIIQPPHFKYVESAYQVARLYMLKGNDLKLKGQQDDAKDSWITSYDYFGELKDHYLVDGSVDPKHPLVAKIRSDHLEVTRLTQIQDLRKLDKFYRDLETGRYKSEATATLARFKEMLWTPVEMMKKAFGSGGEEFGEHDHILEQYEAEARDQEDEMVREALAGGPDAGRRRDSGMGYSSSSSVGGESSLSSAGSGSVTSQMARLRMEKSLSLEDNVFLESTEAAPIAKPDKKRQRTIDE